MKLPTLGSGVKQAVRQVTTTVKQVAPKAPAAQAKATGLVKDAFEVSRQRASVDLNPRAAVEGARGEGQTFKVGFGTVAPPKPPKVRRHHLRPRRRVRHHGSSASLRKLAGPRRHRVRHHRVRHARSSKQLLASLAKSAAKVTGKRRHRHRTTSKHLHAAVAKLGAKVTANVERRVARATDREQTLEAQVTERLGRTGEKATQRAHEMAGRVPHLK